MGLEKWPDQIQKVIQLNEQLAVRHGVMLVGPSGGGKTTVRTVLQRALGAYYHNLTLGEEVGIFYNIFLLRVCSTNLVFINLGFSLRTAYFILIYAKY